MTATNTILSRRADQGQRVLIGDTEMNSIVRTAHTTSSIAVQEWSLPPGCLGAPPHIHTKDDEIFYVLEGELTVMEEEDITTATAGTYVVLPRGRLHTFWNSSDKPVRAMVLLVPGVLEGYFETMGKLTGGDTPPDFAELDRISQEAGLQMRTDLVPQIIAQHGLSYAIAPPPPTEG